MQSVNEMLQESLTELTGEVVPASNSPMPATSQTSTEVGTLNYEKPSSQFLALTAKKIMEQAQSFDGLFDDVDRSDDGIALAKLSFDAIVAFMGEAKALAKGLVKERQGLVSQLKSITESIEVPYREPLKVIDEAVKRANDCAGRFLAIEEEVRLEKQRIAEEKAAEERRLQALEAKRIKDDIDRLAREQEEADRRAAEEMAKAVEAGKPIEEPTTADVVQAQAEELRMAELREQQRDAEVKALTTAAAPVANLSKVRGASIRVKRVPRVIDFATLPDKYKIANERLLTHDANPPGGAEPDPIPGVVFEIDRSVGNRGRR